MSDEYIPGQTPEDGDLPIDVQAIRADWSRFRSEKELGDPRIQKAMDKAAVDAASLSPGVGDNKQEG